MPPSVHHGAGHLSVDQSNGSIPKGTLFSLTSSHGNLSGDQSSGLSGSIMFEGLVSRGKLPGKIPADVYSFLRKIALFSNLNRNSFSPLRP
jgi:hypothetical protein